MAEDLGEKSEEPTPKRQQDAREKGNVARSQDMSAAILLAVATIVLWLGTGPMFEGFHLLITGTLDGSIVGNTVAGSEVMALITYTSNFMMMYVLPVLAAAWLAGYIATFWQIGWLFSPQAVQPKLNKLNPINGFKRIFGISGLVKVSLDSLKVAIVVIVSAVTIKQFTDRMLVLPHLTALQAMGEMGRMMLELAIRVVAVLLLLGLLDFFYQRWKHQNDLKMTKHEVKDEMKQSEGDPEVRQRRMRMQQQIAMQRISSAVPNADVIVTNPEHISIALQYDATSMHAPKVVAKGADYLALRIRQIALAHNIPIVERKPLARALYKDVKIGQEVPPQFYHAVAEILAYVYRLGERKAG